ncbi:hypothetical protein [Streptomyces sp. CMB-StM0423]|uniref:hypothetical protein n=1 Tax=Streptomyces sp. CMB-StM0423 TaxID=2059884 RepID=UPI00131CAABD|nr:hypothetical protein [Streptomyces sp. CMB-StM0423]
MRTGSALAALILASAAVLASTGTAAADNGFEYVASPQGFTATSGDAAGATGTSSSRTRRA